MIRESFDLDFVIYFPPNINITLREIGSHVNVVFFIMTLFYYNNEQRTKLLQCDYPVFWKMTEFY